MTVAKSGLKPRRCADANFSNRRICERPAPIRETFTVAYVFFYRFWLDERKIEIGPNFCFFLLQIDTGSFFAMKKLKKSDVIKHKQAAHVKAERDILSEADNEWVVKLFYSFQVRFGIFFCFFLRNFSFF